VRFLADPDIAVCEPDNADIPNKLAIEIKGGADASNIHNRLGEAEKSHQHARASGYNDTWTIIAVKLPTAEALTATPSTSKLFHLSAMIDTRNEEYEEFSGSLCAALGITRRTMRSSNSP
jgi:hypothetical protein